MRYREIYDEYNSWLLKKSDCSEKLLLLKDGYISTKTISGKKYSYFQKKADGKLHSEYIKEEMLPEIKSGLQKRAEIKKTIKTADAELNRLETAAKTLDKSLYHKFIILKRCSVMDSMPLGMRKKSLEFGNAMTALEGIPASDDSEKNLSLWTAGQHSFKDGYLQTLQKYNLIEDMI